MIIQMATSITKRLFYTTNFGIYKPLFLEATDEYYRAYFVHDSADKYIYISIRAPLADDGSRGPQIITVEPNGSLIWAMSELRIPIEDILANRIAKQFPMSLPIIMKTKLGNQIEVHINGDKITYMLINDYRMYNEEILADLIGLDYRPMRTIGLE
jgi:hypothetical protein